MTTCEEKGECDDYDDLVAAYHLMMQNDAESDDYQSSVSESFLPVTPVRPSATGPPGLIGVAVVAVQTVAVPPATGHGKGNRTSMSCVSADKKGGSGKGHRNDYTRSPRMIEINKAWNIAMGDLPSKPAAPKIKTQCSFFQRGICRLDDRRGDLHDDQPAPVVSSTKEQKNRSKPKGKPAAAAVRVSVPKAHLPVPP